MVVEHTTSSLRERRHSGLLYDTCIQVGIYGDFAEARSFSSPKERERERERPRRAGRQADRQTDRCQILQITKLLGH